MSHGTACSVVHVYGCQGCVGAGGHGPLAHVSELLDPAAGGDMRGGIHLPPHVDCVLYLQPRGTKHAPSIAAAGGPAHMHAVACAQDEHTQLAESAMQPVQPITVMEVSALSIAALSQDRLLFHALLFHALLFHAQAWLHGVECGLHAGAC